MNIQHYAGIDPSKLTFTIALWPEADRSEEEVKEFSNTPSGYKSLGYWLSSHDVCYDELLCCIEHTGRYSLALSFWLVEQGCFVWKQMPLAIKRSMGLQRGKSDVNDAKSIVSYCHTHQQQAQRWKPASKAMQTLGLLMALRNRLIDTQTRLRVPIGEVYHTDGKHLAKQLDKLCSSTLAQVANDLKRIEQQIDQLLAQDQELEATYQLLRSVPGIGKVTACMLLYYTQGFTRFQTPRQLACYCGVAPFEYSSGTSIRGRTKVSHMANKKLKKLLHMAAVSLIGADNEMGKYYQRKVAEGKNKMLVINAVRNKIIHAAMAVVKRGTPYQKTLNTIA